MTDYEMREALIEEMAWELRTESQEIAGNTKIWGLRTQAEGAANAKNQRKQPAWYVPEVERFQSSSCHTMMSKGDTWLKAILGQIRS